MTSTLVVDVAAHDKLRAGQRVRLDRWFPAGYWGRNAPPSHYVAVFTLAKISRLEDWDGEPSWYAEGVEDEHRGCWAVGRVPGGMVTTLTAVEA